MDYVENKEDCMKATGIVRRIDDLGRIVIPKEIRRTLRIRETDPMEIYTDMDGQIVLKKYSPMADVSEFAVEYAESIAQNTGMTIAITDRDCVIAAAGTQKKNVQGKHITKELNDIMDKRQSVVASASENDYVKAVTDYDCESEVISPIICAGDVLGMVIMFGNDKKQKLLKMSIKDNLKLAKSNATDYEINNALHLAQCDDIIAKLPAGVDTMLGTKGVYLSGGERQRIAIARAILKDSPIVILDEATAFADPENEALVQKAFTQIGKNKTVIMIAHRLSTVKDADIIYVLQNGRVSERGTHNELVAKEETQDNYRHMWNEYQKSIAWKVV